MKPTGSSSNWADQANDLAASTEALSIAAKGSANDFGSEAQQEIKYALQWGERVAVSIADAPTALRYLSNKFSHRLPTTLSRRFVQQIWQALSASLTMSCQMAAITTARCYVFVQ